MGIKLVLILALFLFSSGDGHSQELRFISKSKGRITSFFVGDTISFRMKNFLIPAGKYGIITGIHESQLSIDDKLYELNKLTQIRHVKPKVDIILTAIAITFLALGVALFVPFLLPIPKMSILPVIACLAIGYGALITNSIVNGRRIMAYTHDIQFIPSKEESPLLNQNP